MPATSHCALESAGFLPHDLGCAGADAHCGADGCKIVESNLIKQSSATLLKVAPPAEFFCACFICLGLASVPDLAAVADFSSSVADAPQVWVASWEFERRTVLPARAPSLV
jgi:hypothetical protein